MQAHTCCAMVNLRTSLRCASVQATRIYALWSAQCTPSHPTRCAIAHLHSAQPRVLYTSPQPRFVLCLFKPPLHNNSPHLQPLDPSEHTFDLHKTFALLQPPQLPTLQVHEVHPMHLFTPSRCATLCGVHKCTPPLSPPNT